jgi:hypothetical protein
VLISLLTLNRTNKYAELVPSRSLCSIYSSFMADLSSPQLPFDAEDEDSPPLPGSYSTDQGNVTQVCPGIHPIYTIPTENGASNHTKEFTTAVITEEAYRLTLDTSKGMAATAWKFLTDDGFAGKVKAEFEKVASGKRAGGD